MVAVRGTFRNGVAQPVEAVEGHDGQPVLITFLDEEVPKQASEEEWDSFIQFLKGCQVDTGISDLAHEHDHYLYGKPKKGM
jgi:hypothetical protein